MRITAKTGGEEWGQKHRQQDRNLEKKATRKEEARKEKPPEKESEAFLRLFLFLFPFFFLKMLFHCYLLLFIYRGKDAPFGAGRRTIWCVKAHHLVRALIRFYAPFGACLRHASACFCVLLAHFLGRFSGGKKGNRHRRMDASSVKDKGQRGESVRRKKVLA